MKIFLRCILYMVVLPVILIGSAELLMGLSQPPEPCVITEEISAPSPQPTKQDPYTYTVTDEKFDDYMEFFVFEGKATLHYNESFRNYPRPFHVSYSSTGKKNNIKECTIAFPWGYITIDEPRTDFSFSFSNKPRNWWGDWPNELLGRSRPFYGDLVRTINYLMPIVNDGATRHDDTMIDPSVYLIYERGVYRVSRGEAMRNNILNQYNVLK